MNDTVRCAAFRTVALAAALAVWPGATAPSIAVAAERIGGDLSLERIDLRFVGGERAKVLPAGQAARAEAEITFTGSGQLGGAWEIAEPSTTAGAAQFRTLELVSRLLGSGRREVLASPQLPTAATGAYLLRLRITAPPAAAQPPALRYFVGQTGGAAAPDAAGSPAARGALSARGPEARVKDEPIKFSWRAVAGSIAYQLELYEREAPAVTGPAGGDDHEACLVALPSELGRPPVSGMMVPGTQTGVTLSPAAARKLTAGRTYLWRVVALDAAGKALCDSPLKPLAW